MIVIRLAKERVGINQIYFIVVSNHTTSPTSGRILEKIGFYKPVADKLSNKYFYVNFDRLSFWVERGAQCNISLFNLLQPLMEYFFSLNNRKVSK